MNQYNVFSRYRSNNRPQKEATKELQHLRDKIAKYMRRIKKIEKAWYH